MIEDAEELELVEDDEEQPTQLYEHYRFEVDRGQVPVRIDKFMFEKLQHSSRNRIQKAAEAGFVHVNDRPVKSNYKVRPGDVVTLMMDRPHYDTTIEPEDIPLDVVYEDDELMVINKPAGLVVHPGVGNFHGTLVNAIAWHLRNLPSYDPNDPSVGLVHRIDKDTSGLLVIAKTPDAKTELGAQFFNKTTHRSYVALVWGHFTEDSGRIEGNIGRDPKDRLRMAVFPPGSDIGKPAVTHYRVWSALAILHSWSVSWRQVVHTRYELTCAMLDIRCLPTSVMAAVRFYVASARPVTANTSTTASSSATVRHCMPVLWVSYIPKHTSRWTSAVNCQPIWKH